MNPLVVLYEDNHLLAADKPAGLPTMGAAARRDSLVARVRNYLKERYHKSGRVYVGVVSRLDLPVTGVVLFARTSKAASRLAEQFRGRRVLKLYWAVVTGPVDPPQGTLKGWIWHDEPHRRMRMRQTSAPGAREVSLAYRTLRSTHRGTLMEITPHTGRKHQIRAQLAAAGIPILGDRKYGSRRAFSLGIALHARMLEFDHPTRRERIRLEAPSPPAWRGWGFSP
jgi:23S rRNA pseudouridine1911/1915/1917 synthase